jgi:hypothetical protein
VFAFGSVVRYWLSNWFEGPANTALFPYVCTNPFDAALSSVSYSGSIYYFYLKRNRFECKANQQKGIQYSRLYFI